MAFVGTLESAYHGAAVRFHVARQPLDGLYTWFFVDAQHDCIQGRVQIEPDHIGCFHGELLVGAYAPTPEPLEIDSLLAQNTPDSMNAGAEFLCQRRPVPMGHAARRRLFDLRQQAIAELYPIADRLAGSMGILQAL